MDPFTGSNRTWQPDIEQVKISSEKTLTGVVNFPSGSNARSRRASAEMIGT